MNLNEYSTWLIDFSDKYAIADDAKLTVYIAGLIEELNEYDVELDNVYDYLKDNVKAKTELGDVLAYLTLTVSLTDYDINSLVTDFKVTNIKLNELLVMLAGYLKRLHRGDATDGNLIRAIKYTYWYLLEQLTLVDLTIEELIEINVTKLNRMSANNTLLGSGNDR